MKTSRFRNHLTHKLPPCIPNDCAVGIEWFDDPSVAKAARDFEHRWRRWTRMKEIIDGDWQRSAMAELAAVH